MSCRRRFGAVRCREVGKPVTGSAPLSLLGTLLAVVWFILFVAWAVDLARLASSAGSAEAGIAVNVRSAMPSPRHDGDEPAGRGAGVRAMPHPGVGKESLGFSGLPAMLIIPVARVERCFANSTPAGVFAPATPDLRCELAAMANSQHRSGYAYVGPR